MSISLKIKGTISYNQHYLLDGLDVANQHPIEVVTGLREELDKRYIKPVTGIPSTDLAETYININDLNTAQAEYHALYAMCQSDCMEISDRVTINSADIDTNKTGIFNLTTELDALKSKVSSLPGIDSSLFSGAVCIKQKAFEATDTGKICDIIIIDTDLKVIEPTVLKSDNSVAKYGIDYNITYPDDVTLRIEFINNDTYKINYISGEITDSEFNILLEYYKKLESELYMASGAYYKPAHDIQLLYDDNNRVIKEIYTGNVNKIIDYEYDLNDNVIKKTVTQNNVIKFANYQYDANNKLIVIQDGGTDIPLDGTRARAYDLELTYDGNYRVLVETYTGDINKTITYERNLYGDVTKKIVLEDGITKTATYVYDEFRKLIKIVDDGTETVAVVFHGEVPGESTGGTTSIDVITEPEIDLIFATIFND